MGKVLLEGGIVILLVLIGISVFIPSGNGVNDIIVEFENSLESGNVVDDGEMDNVEISVRDDSNLISRLNCEIANTIVDGLNGILDLGIKFLRKIIN